MAANESDIRAEARSLVLAMTLGAPGAEIRARTQRLLYALGHHDEMPQPVNAARLVAEAAAACGAMPGHIGQALHMGDMRTLKAAARALDGKVRLDTLSLGSARLYVVALSLAEVQEGGVLCA